MSVTYVKRMMLRKLICVTIFLQIFVFSSADIYFPDESIKSPVNRQSTGPTCTALNQINGICIPLGDCIYAMSLRVPQRIIYIRNASCDGSTAGKVIICCPNVKNQTFPTPTPESALIFPDDSRLFPRQINIESQSTRKPETKDSQVHQTFSVASGLIECESNVLNRIIGGSVTKIEEFPWTALLFYKKIGTTRLFPSCGGTILAERWILTAAHCVKSARLTEAGIEFQKIRLGEYDFRNQTDCVVSDFGKEICTDYQEFDYAKTILHENYKPTIPRSQPYDVALVKLSGTIRFTDNIQPICIPYGPADPSEEFYAIGWGATENFSKSHVKLSVKLSWFDWDRCKRIYSATGLGFGQFCVGGKAGQDTCKGDSGGPLVTPVKRGNETDYWKLVGITSFGYQYCGTQGRPGIYTSVWDYIPWIESNMEN